jgi:hypothetical protein
MNLYITKLALAFAVVALLAVHAAPQALAVIPGGDGSTATVTVAPDGYSRVDSTGSTKPGYVRYGGVWVRIGSGGGTIPAHLSGPRPSRHTGHKPKQAAWPVFPWSDFGLAAGSLAAALLTLRLGAARLRRVVRLAGAA